MDMSACTMKAKDRAYDSEYIEKFPDLRVKLKKIGYAMIYLR